MEPPKLTGFRRVSQQVRLDIEDLSYRSESDIALNTSKKRNGSVDSQSQSFSAIFQKMHMSLGNMSTPVFSRTPIGRTPNSARSRVTSPNSLREDRPGSTRRSNKHSVGGSVSFVTPDKERSSPMPPLSKGLHAAIQHIVNRSMSRYHHDEEVTLEESSRGNQRSCISSRVFRLNGEMGVGCAAKFAEEEIGPLGISQRLLSVALREDGETKSHGAMMRLDLVAARNIALTQMRERDEALDTWHSVADNRRALEKFGMWMTVIALVRFTVSAHTKYVKNLRSLKRQKDYFPFIVLRLRNWLRRIRIRLRGLVIQRPLLANLMSDNVLGPFDDHILLNLIKNMKLRYFFPGEVIVYKDVVEDEVFVVGVGAADVIVNGAVVFTLRPGMTFGSAGMVSGEPRSATIRAAHAEDENNEPETPSARAHETCGTFCWVGRRKNFDFDKSSPVASQKQKQAHAILTDMRKKNLRLAYASSLTVESLTRMDAFRGIAPDGLVEIIKRATMDCFPPKTIIVPAELPSSMDEMKGFYILRGTVRVLQKLSVLHPAGKTIKERWTQLIDVGGRLEMLSKRNLTGLMSGTLGSSSRMYEDEEPLATSFIVDGEEYIHVVEVSAPCLINFGAAISCEWQHLVVQVGSHSADAAVFSHSNLVSQNDLFFIQELRAVSNKRQERLVLPPPRPFLQSILFPGSLAFDFLRSVRLQRLNLEVHVYNPGDEITFNGTTGFILQSGSIQSVGGNCSPRDVFPFLWPPISDVYYNRQAATVKTTVKRRAEIIRFSCTELIQLVRSALEGAKLHTFEAALRCEFQLHHRKAPVTENDARAQRKAETAVVATVAQRKPSPPKVVVIVSPTRRGQIYHAKQPVMKHSEKLAQFHKQHLQPEQHGADVRAHFMLKYHPPLLHHALRLHTPDAGNIVPLHPKPPLPAEAVPLAPPVLQKELAELEQDSLVRMYFEQDVAERRQQEELKFLAQRNESNLSLLPPVTSQTPCGGSTVSSSNSRLFGLPERSFVVPSSIPQWAPLDLAECALLTSASVGGAASQTEIDQLNALEIMLRKASMM